METNPVLPVSRVRQRVHSASTVTRRRLIPGAEPATLLQDLTAKAHRCHTHKQFHELLNTLQTLIPFQRLICAWGYRSRDTIRFIFNHGFPIPFVRWYLTKGLLWRGPMFREWLRTNRAQVSDDVWRRLANQIDPELLEQARRFNLQGLLAGGVKTRGFWIFFSLCMGSEQNCRAYLPQFDVTVPIVAQALKRACPRALLSERETSILERRAMGEIIKQIAAGEAISERTVREHLQHIKRKLYTDDLVNAVVIAVKSGMLLQSCKK
jgi:DNA-binding NarL/FixJ family response regulator